MNQLVPIRSPELPALVAAAGERASMRFLEFFAANIRNPHTRRAYARAAEEFLAWCASAACRRSPPSSRCMSRPGSRPARASSPRPASSNASPRSAICSTGWSPARSCRSIPPLRCAGPGTSSPAGKRRCSIPPKRGRCSIASTPTVVGLRDRALIGLMVYSFARIGAALGMTVEDVYTQNRRLWVRLREKGGKRHAMPCHHNLDEYLVAYLDGAGLRDDPKGPLFRTIGRGTGKLTRTVLPQANAYAMIRRRAAAAGIETKLGNHSFRATGITAYLKNGGTLEKAAAMANHASTRTTQLYDRRRDEVTLDEVERIVI